MFRSPINPSSSEVETQRSCTQSVSASPRYDMRDLQRVRDVLNEQHCLLQASTEEILRRYPEQLDRQWSQKSVERLLAPWTSPLPTLLLIHHYLGLATATNISCRTQLCIYSTDEGILAKFL